MSFMANNAIKKKSVRTVRNPGSVVVSGKFVGKNNISAQDRSEKLRSIAKDAEKRLKGSMKLLA
jgi:hypothetical protein